MTQGEAFNVGAHNFDENAGPRSEWTVTVQATGRETELPVFTLKLPREAAKALMDK